jgi:hypothetical protein
MDLPIYSKVIWELCFTKPGKKLKDPQTVHAMGKLSYVMMGGFLATKYFDPRSLFVNVKIYNTLISNTLIDLGATINIMTHNTMQSLGLTSLSATPIVHQLAYRSTFKPEWILEYVVIF